MRTIGKRSGREATKARVSTWLTLGIAVAMFFALAGNGEAGGFCSKTARAQFVACKAEVRVDRFIGKATCINTSDAEERKECFTELNVARKEGNQLCREQRDGRLGACKSLGEGRYDPDFDPADFDSDFANLTHPNPYFPLKIGYRWEYQGEDETNTVEVKNKTKLIEGVRCIVVRDTVKKNGVLVEDTDDWFAQAKDGNVWYCGEEVKDYESFDGDQPRRPELVSIDGSFKAGRDGDQPGIIFLASPKKGDVYREEFSLSNAEDVTEILSTNYKFGNDPDLDEFVPQPLADYLCAGDCIVTKNYSLLEPGIFAHKYYARGIGFFLEVNPDTGEVLQLVGCSFDPRCEDLPKP